MRYCLSILLIFKVSCGFSQDSLHLDSLTDEQVNYEFFYKTKFQLEFASTRTLITQGTSIHVTGVHLGIQYKHHYKLGATILSSETYRTESLLIPEVKYIENQLQGFGVYFEYVAIEDYRYYLSAPITLASAWINSVPYDQTDEPLPVRAYESADFPYTTIGIAGGYSLFYWLAISGGVGYRKSFVSDPAINNILSTPYYNVGLKFRFGRFMKVVMQRDHVLKMKSVYFRERNPQKSKQLADKYFEVLQKKERKLNQRNAN